MGSRAAGFTLTALDGSTVSLADYQGRIVIVDFWATWCKPCVMEVPHFIALQNQYGAQGLQVIGVAVGDREDMVRRFVRDMGINYIAAMGDEALVQSYGGFTAIPTTFLVGPDGKIAARFTGYQDKEVFVDAVEKLLPAVRRAN